jgi:ribosomal protein L40E
MTSGWICIKCGHGNMPEWEKCRNCKSPKKVSGEIIP